MNMTVKKYHYYTQNSRCKNKYSNKLDNSNIDLETKQNMLSNINFIKLLRARHRCSAN
jgi:hypothetical protein